MKNMLTNVVFILLLIAGGYIFYLREFRIGKDCPGKGNVIVLKSVWDSIRAIQNLPPIIKHDTVYLQGQIKYVNLPIPVGKIDSKDSTVNIYQDSLVNKEINVKIDFRVHGTLIDRNWSYIPILTQVNTEITKFVPKIVDNPVPVSKRGLFVYGIVGGNANSFLPGCGLDYITKRNTEIGYLYQRFGNQNLHSLKLGIKLF